MHLKMCAEVVAADLEALRILKPGKRASDEAAFQEMTQFDEAFCQLRQAILRARLKQIDGQNPALAAYVRARLEAGQITAPGKPI